MNPFLDRYGLLVGLLLLFLVTFVWPSYRVWKRTGIRPITFGNTDSAHGYVGRIFKVVLGALVAVASILAFFPRFTEYLLPIFYFQHPLLPKIGWVLLLLTLGWVSIAQRQMADSWRIGVDEKHATRLVTTGIFGVSRNPIFLGMAGMLLAVLLISPNAFTLLLFVLGIVLMQIQIRLEESFLSHQHGEAYQQYRQRTRRWL